MVNCVYMFDSQNFLVQRRKCVRQWGLIVVAKKRPPFGKKKGYHAHGDHVAALKALTCHCLTNIQPLVKVLAPVDHLLDEQQKTSLKIVVAADHPEPTLLTQSKYMLKLHCIIYPDLSSYFLMACNFSYFTVSTSKLSVWKL